MDLDPVLLELARRRSDVPRWASSTLAVDLREDRWTRITPRPDAIVVLSTIHYLPARDVATLYRRAREALAPGGLLFVADRIADGADAPTAPLDDDGWTWERWWREAEATPELADAFADRARAGGLRSADWAEDETWHRDHLAGAGFSAMDVIHRRGPDAVLLATTD